MIGINIARSNIATSSSTSAGSRSLLHSKPNNKHTHWSKGVNLDVRTVFTIPTSFSQRGGLAARSRRIHTELLGCTPCQIHFLCCPFGSGTSSNVLDAEDSKITRRCASSEPEGLRKDGGIVGWAFAGHGDIYLHTLSILDSKSILLSLGIASCLPHFRTLTALTRARSLALLQYSRPIR